MPKKDDCDSEPPKHVRKAQEDFLRERHEDDDPDEETPDAIDWKTGEPRDLPGDAS